MSPEVHATLSPSSSERWISCPASVQLIATSAPPEQVSAYALEGTVAHALGEIRASIAFGYLTEKQGHDRIKSWRKKYRVDPQTESEMEHHISKYVTLLQERAELHPHTQVRLEQRLNTGIPSCWGTGDAILVSPSHVEVVDLKYGRGVEVQAEGNTQLRLYGVGALDSYGDILGETDTVYMTIFQPRLHHTLTAEMSADDLRAWRDRIIPIAQSALDGTGEFGPSEQACRWCPLSGRCKAQLEYVTARDFATPPELMGPADLAEALAIAPAIKDWLAALEIAALSSAYSEGKTIPGYKVVMSGGRRVIDNLEGVAEVLTMVGYDYDQFSSRKLRGIGELEKLLGKERMSSLLSDFIRKTEGKPAIVPEADPRPSASPDVEAAKVFDAVGEGT